jgi:hypothetical protein
MPRRRVQPIVVVPVVIDVALVERARSLPGSATEAPGSTTTPPATKEDHHD